MNTHDKAYQILLGIENVINPNNINGKSKDVKQLAIMQVNFIIQNGNLEPQLKRHIGNVPPLPIHLEYWFEVKQEIEKL